MNFKLLASAPTLSDIAKMVGKYWCRDVPYDLRPKDDKTWAIHYPAVSPRAGQELTSYRVILKGRRYRFEVNMAA